MASSSAASIGTPTNSSPGVISSTSLWGNNNNGSSNDVSSPSSRSSKVGSKNKSSSSRSRVSYSNGNFSHSHSHNELRQQQQQQQQQSYHGQNSQHQQNQSRKTSLNNNVSSSSLPMVSSSSVVSSAVSTTMGTSTADFSVSSSRCINVEESHAHLSTLLDELVHLRQMTTTLSEQLADVTQERNALQVERDDLKIVVATTSRATDDDDSSSTNVGANDHDNSPTSSRRRRRRRRDSSDRENNDKAEAAAKAAAAEANFLKLEMESLRVMNERLSDENHRLISERNNSSMMSKNDDNNNNSLEYTSLCTEVADLRSTNKELEVENQEMSNDMHDMMNDIEELHNELNNKQSEIDILMKEQEKLIIERDDIADKFWDKRERIVDSSNYEDMIEHVKQQNQLKISNITNDKILIEEKLHSVSQERDRLQTRVERLGEELDAAEATITESKKSIAKWKRVAGIISKEVGGSGHGGADNDDEIDGGTGGGEGGGGGRDRRRYHRNHKSRHNHHNNNGEDDDDDDDDDSISVCTMQTYHATSELEKRIGGGVGKFRRGSKAVSSSSSRRSSDNRRDSSDGPRSLFNYGCSLKDVTKNALSLTGFDTDGNNGNGNGGFAPHKRLSEFAQSGSSFFSSVRSVSSRSNVGDEPSGGGMDSDNESILMYPSLGSIAGK